MPRTMRFQRFNKKLIAATVAKHPLDISDGQVSQSSIHSRSKQNSIQQSHINQFNVNRTYINQSNSSQKSTNKANIRHKGVNPGEINQFIRDSSSSQEVNAVNSQVSNRLFVPDIKSGQKFLIDTGAEVSVIPSTRVHRLSKNRENTLFAANGTIIETYGVTRLTLDLGLRRPFTWNFTIADTKYPIIGMDFLRNFNLLIDVKKNKLIDTIMALSRPGICSLEASTFIKTYNDSTVIADLLREFNSITQLNTEAPEATPTGVTHCIETQGAPVFAKARRLTPDKFRAAKDEFDFLIKHGICRPSKSPYASPLHLVKKNLWRMAPVRRLSFTKQANGEGSLSFTTHSGFHAFFTWKKGVQQDRPQSRISPNTNRAKRHP